VGSLAQLLFEQGQEVRTMISEEVDDIPFACVLGKFHRGVIQPILKHCKLALTSEIGITFTLYIRVGTMLDQQFDDLEVASF
jgi:hypothetical protein